MVQLRNITLHIFTPVMVCGRSVAIPERFGSGWGDTFINDLRKSTTPSWAPVVVSYQARIPNLVANLMSQEPCASEGEI